eukprot:COSAG04_NODE_85_length_27560_cov_8.621245_6_plen_838_part_00
MGSCIPAVSDCCPRGEVFWSSTQFRVSNDKGGAISASGLNHVHIRDTQFQVNEADRGASISFASTLTARITNTTIDEPVDPWSTAVQVFGMAVETCFENPCDVGFMCSFKASSTFCDACGPNEIGTDGISCVACRPGTQPDASQTQCVDCGPGQFSTIGICLPCPQKSVASGDGVGCSECPSRYQPNDEQTKCVCKAGTFDVKAIGTTVTCQSTSLRSDGMETDECATCPECLDCAIAGQTTLKSGWAFFGIAGEAYRCPGWSKFEACPSLLLTDNTTMDSSTCAMGYQGPVCGNCEPEYNHLKVGNPCSPCDQGVINIPLVMCLFVAALVVGWAVVSGTLAVLQSFGIITDLRILVGFYQILGQTGNVLDVVFPFPVPQLVDFVKLLFLDVRKLVMLDCWNIGGFYGKIVTNVVVVPTIIAGVCQFIYASQKRTVMAVIAAGNAAGNVGDGFDESALNTAKVQLKQNLFLGIFLVYPTITTTLFRVPQCHEFGEESFHEDDYTIDCNSNKFTLTAAFALFVIILIPIGVPVAFLFLMLRAKRSIGGVVNTTAEGGAKLVPVDDDDESDAYGFLVKDYRPECWYHEIVTYARKLTLTGVSVVMGRGSMAQTYFVITTEAFFQIHHVRTYPFVNYKHNVIEALGHCALMLLYAVSLILRNESEDDWSEEWFPKEGYGWFLVLVFAIVLPSPIMFFFVKGKGKASDRPPKEVDPGAGREEFQDNPLAVGSSSTEEIAVDVKSSAADIEDLTLKQVKARAKELGVSDGAINDTIQQMIKAEAEAPPTEEQLREALADLNVKQLKARAREAGASGDAIDDLDEAPDIKAAAMDLIVSLELA